MKLTIKLAALLLALLIPAASLADVIPLPVDQSGGYPVSAENLVADEEYLDESIHVETQRITFKGAKCLYIHITVADPTQLRTAMTRDEYDKKEYVKTKLLAKKKNSVLAVNGDFFKYNDFGYLVREGILYRDRPDGKHDVLLIDENADFHTVTMGTPETVHAAVDDLEKQGHRVINSFNFGPVLMLNGEIQPFDRWQWEGDAKMMRIAVGQLGPLEYGIYFCYGTTDGTSGLTMERFADFVQSVTPDVKTAYNLDGGGSAHIVLLEHQLHNNPSGRDICDILYFASASNALGTERAK